MKEKNSSLYSIPDIININYKNTYLLPKINMEYYVSKGLFESSLIEWCKIFYDETKVFIDVGAHTGTYAITLSEGFEHVYAFEPQRMTYYALCGSVALSSIENITCVNTALSDIEGTQDLNIISIDGGGSTLCKHNKTFKTEEVEVRTLDSYRIENVGFIKIDVEGYELNVLKGAIETIKAYRPKILFENNDMGNFEVVNYLNSIGYKIHPVNNYNNMFLATYNI